MTTSTTSRRAVHGSVLGLCAGVEVSRSIVAAAEQAMMMPTVEPSLRAAEAWLDDHHPTAIIVDGEAQAIEATCFQLRERPSLANVPIVAMTDRVDDLAFQAIFGSGGDDLVPRGAAEQLGRRLRAFASGGDVPLSRQRGMAVVAHADSRARVLTGRALRNAGFAVVFATDAQEALARSRDAGVELVVSAAELEDPAGDMIAARARSHGVTAAWVVMASPRDVARMRARLNSVPRTGAYDAFGPPENVLFLANELIKGGVVEARKSPRVLFGTSVRFRAAGAETDEIGYSYNLSAGGIYIRTLAPLPRGSEAWLELDPPRCDRRVRLEGRVVWTRAFGPNDVATVPAGFGVQITGGSIADIERLTRGYRAFASEMG